VFKNGLDNLITNGDEQNVLWRTVLNSLVNHGGGMQHLNGLLADAKGKRELTNRIAKLVVGKVWELTEQSVDLGLAEKDFHCSPREFLARYPKVSIHCALDLVGGKCVDSIPWAPCQYRLFHFGGPVLFRKASSKIPSSAFAGLPKGAVVEHAGWRELLAYVHRLKGSELCTCSILSGGSPISGENSFPAAQEHPIGNPRGEEITLVWRGVKRPKTEPFWTDCFFLVRIYQ